MKRRWSRQRPKYPVQSEAFLCFADAVPDGLYIVGRASGARLKPIEQALDGIANVAADRLESGVFRMIARVKQDDGMVIHGVERIHRREDGRLVIFAWERIRDASGHAVPGA